MKQRQRKTVVGFRLDFQKLSECLDVQSLCQRIFVQTKCDPAWSMDYPYRFNNSSVKRNQLLSQVCFSRSRLFAIKPIAKTLRCIASGLLPLILILQLSIGVSCQCLVDQCAMEFTRSVDMDKIIIGPNVPYCLLAQEYMACLKKTSRTCRGDLKFHTLNTLLNNQNKELNCTGIIENRHHYQQTHRSHDKHPRRNNDLESKHSGADFAYDGETASDGCLFPFTHHRGRGPSDYRHCGLFGDPHLRTFDGQYETCKTVGAWPLVDNSYLGVQVTNEPVGAGFVATGISKITVIVKSLTSCTTQKTYEATKDSLPSAFDDGSSGSGFQQSGNGRPVLQIKTISPDAHVEIILRYVSTKVVIRRAGGYLTFAIRTPAEVIDQHSSLTSLQLCLTGCPASQKIGYKEVLAFPDHFVRTLAAADPDAPVDPAMPKHEAERICREAGVTDFYFDSCVFDLLLTGERSAAVAAAAAQEDVRTLYPPYRRHYETNRTSLAIYEDLGRAQMVREIQLKRSSTVQSMSAASSNAISLIVSRLLMLAVVANAVYSANHWL